MESKSYKYSLLKGAAREICPSCGHRSFKPYVDLSGTPLAPEVGRCNRENNCRYHLSPAEYLVGKTVHYHSLVRGAQNSSLTARTKFIRPDHFHPDILKSSLKRYDSNPLVSWLHSVFSPYLATDKIDAVIKQMLVGTSQAFGGSTVFWQVDQYGYIRDGKVMGYDPLTGLRIKQPFARVNHVHSILKKRFPGNYRSCFFGSHLLKFDFADRPIWLFESEKAALIMALAFTWGGTWLGIPMATGGCAAFNPNPQNMQDPAHPISVLRHRRVVLFPDQGKWHDWNEKGKALKNFSKEVYIATVMERDLHPYRVECEINEGDGFDDLLLRYFKSGLDVADLILTSYGFRGNFRIV